MLSYNKEQANGDARYNIITVVMHHLKLDLGEAMKWAAKYHDEIKSKIFICLSTLPSFGPEVDKEVHVLISHVAHAIGAHVLWSFECKRYFGEKGLEVQRTRVVEMLPSPE
jgi:hypothetical protein